MLVVLDGVMMDGREHFTLQTLRIKSGCPITQGSLDSLRWILPSIAFPLGLLLKGGMTRHRMTLGSH